MENYTLKQHLKIIKIYYESSVSVTVTLRKLTPILGRHNRPNKTTIQIVMTKFERTFSLLNIVDETRQRISKNVEIISAVRQRFSDDPNVSISHRS